MTASGKRLPTLLTVEEAAQCLRVCTKTVRRLIARGDLPVLRIGNRVRVAEDALRAYLTRSSG